MQRIERCPVEVPRGIKRAVSPAAHDSYCPLYWSSQIDAGLELSVRTLGILQSSMPILSDVQGARVINVVPLMTVMPFHQQLRHASLSVFLLKEVKYFASSTASIMDDS